MPRPIKWKEPRIFKLKLNTEDADRYKMILNNKKPKKTVQQDFEDHVRKVITE